VGYSEAQSHQVSALSLGQPTLICHPERSQAKSKDLALATLITVRQKCRAAFFSL